MEKSIKTEIITQYSVDLDKSRSNGILHFTHELIIYFIKKYDKIEFSHADVFNPGGWDTYKEDEINLLEADYPGAIEEAKKILIAEQGIKKENFA